MRGYVHTRWGQVHYRRAGDRGPHVVLFHESPLSSRVYETVLPHLAGEVRAIAFDTPGYGLSDSPPEGTFEIPDYAEVLAEAMSALHVGRAVVGGVHTGASIAVALAAHAPERVAGLVLSGVPLFDERERAEMAAGWTPPVEIDADGGQFRWAVERYRRIWGAGAPPELVHLAALELLNRHGEYSRGYQAAFRYDPAADLAAATAPTLLLDAEYDMLADKDPLAMELARDAALVVLPGLPGQPHLREPRRYAEEIVKFVRRASAREQGE